MPLNYPFIARRGLHRGGAGALVGVFREHLAVITPFVSGLSLIIDAYIYSMPRIDEQECPGVSDAEIR
jgi:hypothetical protein